MVAVGCSRNNSLFIIGSHWLFGYQVHIILFASGKIELSNIASTKVEDLHFV